MLAAEAAYCALEDDLQHYLDTYESTHDYDEYHFDLDEIEHDPYVLLSLLCALHEGQWTIGEVQGTLQMLFDRQYILTEDVVVETRYRTETDTWTDEDGNSHTYTYQVPYDYYICTVTLENFDLSHVPAVSYTHLNSISTLCLGRERRPSMPSVRNKPSFGDVYKRQALALCAVKSGNIRQKWYARPRPAIPSTRRTTIFTPQHRSTRS